MNRKLIGIVSGLLVMVCLIIPACSKTYEIPYVFGDVIVLGNYDAPPVNVALDTNFPDFPNKIAVYEIVRPVIGENYASNLATQLGFSGNPWPMPEGDKRMVYSYVNKDQTLIIGLNGSISITSNNYSLEKPKNLPSNENCISIAKKWLSDHGMYPENVVGITTSPAGEVRDINDGISTVSHIPGTSVEFHVAVNGVIISGGGVIITIGDNGIVLSMQTNKYALKPAFEVSLKDINDAYIILENYLSSQVPTPTDNIECIVNYRLLSSLEIAGIDLHFSYSTYNNYLLPIYVFTGDGYNEYVPETAYAFIGKVDAALR